VTGFDWVSNDEKTRWFLVMRFSRTPQNGLNEMLRISNQIVQDFRQPPLYTKVRPSFDAHYSQGYKMTQKQRLPKDPRPSSQRLPSQREPLEEADMSYNFHISIAWALSGPTEDSKEKLDQASHDFQAMKIGINTVKIKIGNSVTSVSLTSKLGTSNAIIKKCCF